MSSAAAGEISDSDLRNVLENLRPKVTPECFTKLPDKIRTLYDAYPQGLESPVSAPRGLSDSTQFHREESCASQRHTTDPVATAPRSLMRTCCGCLCSPTRTLRVVPARACVRTSAWMARAACCRSNTTARTWRCRAPLGRGCPRAPRGDGVAGSSGNEQTSCGSLRFSKSTP